MLTYAATSDGPPQDAWALIARPARWHEWAPPIRGAHALGDPEIEAVAAREVPAAGSLVAVDLEAPRAVEAFLRVTYGPLTHLLMRNLARVADTAR